MVHRVSAHDEKNDPDPYDEIIAEWREEVISGETSLSDLDVHGATITEENDVIADTIGTTWRELGRPATEEEKETYDVDGKDVRVIDIGEAFDACDFGDLAYDVLRRRGEDESE